MDLAWFLWHELPTKWACPVAERLRIAHASGGLLRLLDMPRLAAMCTSKDTGRVLMANARRGCAAGARAARVAMAAWGVEPPSTPDMP